jgi:hypothetical protein
MKKKSAPTRRPRLRKRTNEECSRFWQEYAQKFQDANNSVTSGRNTFAVPFAGKNEGNGGDVQTVGRDANGMGRKDRLVFRESAAGDGDEYRDRERAAVEEAKRKARQIAPLYPKGAYQLITEGNREALSNDGRGKK